ncbi:hypothetical protein ACS8FD_13840 [Psychrobacter sp. 1U2]|uniref:hypothetical protein n=1 Tax=unclassified Psychrobacter TaxID=196806 RepID=UPI003F47BFA1
MRIRGKEYKLSDISLIAFVVILFVWTIDSEPDKELEIYQQELTEKESWLISELNNIADFLNSDESDYDYTNREVWFYSWYYGYSFDKDRLLRLEHNLLKRGWIDVTDSIGNDNHIALTVGKSKETAKNMRILCNDKATTLLYMTDMQKDVEYSSTGVRTLVELLYDYSLPCYDLNEEKYDSRSGIESDN